MTDAGSTCLLCGEPAELSIHEIWADGNFQLATCCPGLLEQIAGEIEADPAWGRSLLRHLGAEDLTGHVLRRISDGQGNGPVLDFKLRLTRIRPDGRRHRRQPCCSRFQRTRDRRSEPALHPRRPQSDDPMLRWNCCSKLYAHAATEAERRGFGRIVTYIRAGEEGTSLRAAGWVCDRPAGGRRWHSIRRARSNRNAWIAKERWSRTLRPKPAAGARLQAHHKAQENWLGSPQAPPGFIVL